MTNFLTRYDVESWDVFYPSTLGPWVTVEDYFNLYEKYRELCEKLEELQREG